MLAPKVPIFWIIIGGELMNVKIIKVDAKQIEHRGINKFWKNTDVCIVNGSTRK